MATVATNRSPNLPPAPRVLMYHSISPSTELDPHSLRVHPDRLDRQLRHLRRRGLRGVPAAEWLAAVDRGRAGRLVALTFDDGYRDFVEYAMPVMARHGMTGSVYMVAGKISGSSDWVEGGPDAPLMSADELRAAAAAGHEVGCHTSTHPKLGEIGQDDVAAEVIDSRRVLEEVLQTAVEGFAYPYGSFSDAAVEAVRDAGYAYALATDDHTRPGRFTIPRFFVGQQDSALRLEAKFVRHRLRARRGAAAE
jgi:peptidoglycan/xylan/chitin deacetylase (PgdA/CDA1 family)